MLNVQLPMQNCIVQYFIVDAAHGVKDYQVNFPTQQTSYHLDFPIRSYDRFSGDCTEGHQPCEAAWEFSSWWLLSYYNSRNSKLHSHPTSRVVPCINTLCISVIEQDFKNKIEPLLFIYVLTNSDSDLYPSALVISFAGLQKRRLHPLPIGAPTPFRVRLDWL